VRQLQLVAGNRAVCAALARGSPSSTLMVAPRALGTPPVLAVSAPSRKFAARRSDAPAKQQSAQARKAFIARRTPERRLLQRYQCRQLLSTGAERVGPVAESSVRDWLAAELERRYGAVVETEFHIRGSSFAP
jgi:hypothetical protein